MSDSSSVAARGGSDDPRENHNRFIACFQKHGFATSVDAWEVMGDELGWTTEDVKTYAYRYFIALKNSTAEFGDDSIVRKREDDWSLEESILFETLLVQYLPKIQSQLGSHGEGAWAEQIAAQIPGRTPREVNRRYDATYRHQGTHADTS